MARDATFDAYARMSALGTQNLGTVAPKSPAEMSSEITAIRSELARAEFYFLPIHTLLRAGILRNESLINADHAIAGGVALL